VSDDCLRGSCDKTLAAAGVFWLAAMVVAAGTFANLARRAGPLRAVACGMLLAVAIGSLAFSTALFYKEELVQGGIVASVMMAASVAFVVLLPPPAAPVAARRNVKAQRSPTPLARQRPSARPGPGTALVMGRPVPRSPWPAQPRFRNP